MSRKLGQSKPVNLRTDGAPAKQFSKTFLQGMLSRCAMGFLRYGDPGENVREGVDMLGCAAERIKKYKKDGNTEWLIDAGNFLMFEFMHPQHKEAHFKPTSDTASPGRVFKKGKR